MSDSSVLQNDLRDMLRALGLSDAARPQSPHEVFRTCIVKIERQRKALAAVEEWWLADGRKYFTGAPYAIFAVREALRPMTKEDAEERKLP